MSTTPGIVSVQEGTININGQFVNQNAATGAYYDYDELDGKFFNTVNINLHGSVCLFLNSSVFLSARYFYGLSDITNDFYSVKKSVLDSDSNPIPNPQDNRSLSTQFSQIGRASRIGRDRQALIMSGSAILQAMLRSWPTDKLTVADRGLREGLLYAQMSANGVLEDTIL